MIADWRTDHWIDPATRKKVVFAQGLGSWAGARTFERLENELGLLGYGPGDYLEVTPLVDAGTPRPYQSDDLRGPLELSAAGVAACLVWYLERLPEEQDLHLVGYSLGGLLLLRAADRLVRLRPDLTGDRLRSLITLNAPLAGLPADAPGVVGALVGLGRHLREAEALLDPVIQDLLAEARDPLAAERRDAEYAHLVAAGLRITVVGSLDDQIVAPARVTPDIPGLERVEIVNETVIRPTLRVDRLVDRLLRAGQRHGVPVPGLDRPGTYSFWFGHAAILSDPAALLAVWEHLGHQEPVTG